MEVKSLSFLLIIMLSCPYLVLSCSFLFRSCHLTQLPNPNRHLDPCLTTVLLFFSTTLRIFQYENEVNPVLQPVAVEQGYSKTTLLKQLYILLLHSVLDLFKLLFIFLSINCLCINPAHKTVPQYRQECRECRNESHSWKRC